MKKSRKRIALILAVVMMMVSILPTVAMAAATLTGVGAGINKGTSYITCYGTPVLSQLGYYNVTITLQREVRSGVYENIDSKTYSNQYGAGSEHTLSTAKSGLASGYYRAYVTATAGGVTLSNYCSAISIP
ncbi:MAG: hypothetical protein AAGU12_07710 [Clostridiales bacterium]